MAAPYQTEVIAKKADLANWLGIQLKASRYLEVATATTGFQFALVSRTLFSTVHRALYRAPADYNDGQPVTFLSAAADSAECEAALTAAGRFYDVVFIDPWHSYEASMRDLELGVARLAPDGVLVVHDCHPLRREIALPEHTPGEWMGVTYLAFLDFMRDHPELDYCVADMDYGCGVIWRNPTGRSTMAHRDLLASCNYRDWDTYLANRRQLLNLLSTQETLRHLRRCPITALTASLYRLTVAVRQAPSAMRENPRVKKVIRITQRTTRRLLGLAPVRN